MPLHFKGLRGDVAGFRLSNSFVSKDCCSTFVCTCISYLF